MTVLLQKLGVIAATAVAYLFFCRLNAWLFSLLNYSQGVDWIFLPSGLRLAFILVFVELGAIGVCLATTLLAFYGQVEANLSTCIGTGIVSGVAPLLARKVCIQRLGLDASLHNITSRALFVTSAVFAVVSASLHQTWYFWLGITNNLFGSILVMTVGDFLGTVVLLYVAKMILAVFLPDSSEEAGRTSR